MANGQRLLSLDILRGITVAGMILVNNGWGESFEMLGHSKWNGMTPCDLVFPFFLFIMGISCYLSLVKSEFKPTPQVIRRIVKRTVLVIYTAILVMGNGYAEDASVNVLAQVDLNLFGYDHIYHKSPVDPEGLMGTISSVAHVLLGFYCGMMIKKRETVEQKVIALFVVGTIGVIGGYLLSYGLPLNKRIWSPSYVLMTCGLASLLQALLMYVIDIQKKSGWTTFFHVFGVNALALYVSSELLAILLGNIGVSEVVYNGIHAVIPALKWASLAYAIYFVLLNFAIGYVLYRKNNYYEKNLNGSLRNDVQCSIFRSGR